MVGAADDVVGADADDVVGTAADDVGAGETLGVPSSLNNSSVSVLICLACAIIVR